jgi:hypothetical protein
MGYYIRAFCTAKKPPTVRSVLQALTSSGVRLTVEDDYDNSGTLDSPDWRQFAFEYKPGKRGIQVQCNRLDGSGDGLAAAEIEEFIELIGPPERSKQRRKVVEHLESTQFIIACQLPSTDIDDDGFNANGEFLNYFVTHCGGMIQADGEGFYDGHDLIVPLK